MVRRRLHESRWSSMASPGIIEVPTRPGLGYHVDPVKVRRYQVRQQEFTNVARA